LVWGGGGVAVCVCECGVGVCACVCVCVLLLYTHDPQENRNKTYRRDLDLLAGMYDFWLRKRVHDTGTYLAQYGLVGGSTIGDILQRAERRSKTHQGPSMRESEVRLYRTLGLQLTGRNPVGSPQLFARSERIKYTEVAKQARLPPGKFGMWLDGHGSKSSHLSTAGRFKVQCTRARAC
jgi:hypothetical protein